MSLRYTDVSGRISHINRRIRGILFETPTDHDVKLHPLREIDVCDIAALNVLNTLYKNSGEFQ